MVLLLVLMLGWVFLGGKARKKELVPLPKVTPGPAVPEWKRRQAAQRLRARRVLRPRFMTFEKGLLRIAVVPDGTYYAVKHGTYYRLGRTGVDRARQDKDVKAAAAAVIEDAGSSVASAK